MADDSEKTVADAMKSPDETGYSSSSEPPAVSSKTARSLEMLALEKEDNKALKVFFDEVRTHGDESENVDHLWPGVVLNGRYVVGNVVGRGAAGVTYAGFDKMLATKIAIKEWFPSGLASRSAETASLYSPSPDLHKAFQKGLRLFLQEAEKIARFTANPCIVSVSDFFEENETGYMVMDYVEGNFLTDEIRECGGKLPVPSAMNIILSILDALSELHSVNLFHLDVSPKNIILIGSQTPVLIDFGGPRRSACETENRGAVPDTAKIGPWSDVYACGAVLYEMITGTAPPPAVRRAEKILEDGRDSLVPPNEIPGVNLTETVNNAILKSLAVNREDRFQTAGEFKNALEGKAFESVPKAERKKGLWKRPAFALLLAILGAGAYQQLWIPSSKDTQTKPPNSAMEKKQAHDKKDIPKAPDVKPDPIRPPATARPEPVVEYGVVNIFTRPSVTMYIDGKPMGNTPKAGLTLPAGMAKFRFVSESEGIDVERTIQIKAGDNNKVVLDFTGDN